MLLVHFLYSVSSIVGKVKLNDGEHVGFVELCIAWSRVLVLKFYVLFSRDTGNYWIM